MTASSLDYMQTKKTENDKKEKNKIIIEDRLEFETVKKTNDTTKRRNRSNAN